MSIESEISALFIASGPLNVAQTIFTSFRPSAAACFSSSLLVLHHVELQVAHRELARDADFLRLRRKRHAHQCGSSQQDAESFHDVSSLHAFFL
jgi:hypothetical protein